VLKARGLHPLSSRQRGGGRRHLALLGRLVVFYSFKNVDHKLNQTGKKFVDVFKHFTISPSPEF
jgi:hypothetical protein